MVDPNVIGMPIAGLAVAGGIGFTIGYAIKKVFKLLMIAVGLFLGALLYLQTQKILAVDWTKINDTVTKWVQDSNLTGIATGQGDGFVGKIITAVGVPNTSAFAVMMLIGFWRG